MIKRVLQQFLGIVNYARNYIDNLAKACWAIICKAKKEWSEVF